MLCQKLLNGSGAISIMESRSPRRTLSSFGNPLPLAKETFKKAQSSLTDVLERQPLALGVVGLAIGAAVAGAFRTSDIENQSVGEFSDTVKAFGFKTDARE